MNIRKSFRATKYLMSLLSVCFFLFQSVDSFSQLPNASEADPDYIDFIESNLSAETDLFIDTSNPDLHVNLTLEPFIVLSADGLPHFNPGVLDNSLPQVNAYFKNIGIRFRTGTMHTVNEYPYAVINHRDSTREMEAKYALPVVINLFLVDSIIFDSTAYFGYSRFPNDTLYNSMFICKDQLTGNTLSALLGSFFGLMRTHETAGGAEFENGNLCESLGDYICDTRGDGGMYEQVDTNCIYQGTAIDPAGAYYTPSVANIMSDSPDICRCIFTLQQYRRMKFYYLNYREDLR